MKFLPVLALCSAVLLFVLFGGERTAPLLYGMRVTYARTPLERMQGLSGRASFDHDEVMLFIHDEEAVQGYWMKDMRFPIDIIFLASTSEIVAVHENVLPETYPRVFSSGVPALYVLECTAGCAQRKGWQVGVKVMVPLDS